MDSGHVTLRYFKHSNKTVLELCRRFLMLIDFCHEPNENSFVNSIWRYFYWVISIIFVWLFYKTESKQSENWLNTSDILKLYTDSVNTDMPWVCTHIKLAIRMQLINRHYLRQTLSEISLVSKIWIKSFESIWTLLNLNNNIIYKYFNHLVPMFKFAYDWICPTTLFYTDIGFFKLEWSWLSVSKLKS